jgi:uncharacterized protein YegP (UPF0339 family)
MGYVGDNEVQKAADYRVFFIYQDGNSEWRWKYYSSGNLDNIIAESVETYDSCENCKLAIEKLIKDVSSAHIAELIKVENN